MPWHFRFGYAAMTMLLFRLLWGVLGGRWSRFGNFVPLPATVWRYLRSSPPERAPFEIGHNPLGALSVLAVLALLAVQVSTGLVADDEISNTGPLYRFVSGATSSAMTHWHTGPGQWGLGALICLHLAAIAYHRRRHGADLLRPMLTGDKHLPTETPASTDTLSTRALAAGLLLACAALVGWIVGLGG
jgi:cytochrome b